MRRLGFLCALLPVAALASPREFAAIPGEPWRVAAYTEDGSSLAFCAAEAEAKGRRFAFRREAGGIFLTIEEGGRSLLPEGRVRLAAGPVAEQVEVAGGRAALGDEGGMIAQIIGVLYEGHASSLEVADLALPVRGLDAALIELGTCFRNARPKAPR